MNTLKQRFALLAQTKPEITRADLARATGASAPSVHAWFSGDTKSMKAVTAAKAAQLYGCNTRWLSDGEGEMWPEFFQAHGFQTTKFGMPSAIVSSPASLERIDLAQALDVLANTLETLPEAARLEAAPLLQAMTLAPDSKRLRNSLLAVLMKRGKDADEVA